MLPPTEVKTENLTHTLGGTFTRSGVGLHRGLVTQVTVKPAEVGQGRYFVRIDLPNSPEIPATLPYVHQTTLSTELGQGETKIRTVEHLLAALTGLGIDNARIEINGSEIPLLDGSAQEWVTGITSVGITSQTAKTPPTFLTQPVWIHEGDSFIAAIPSPETRFSYGIDFAVAPIGNQWYSWSPNPDSFIKEIAPARTFGLAHQVEQLRQAGLIQGGSLDNALVCDHEHWLNPPLRFANEPVRHKILDLIGDLSLLGSWPCAHYLAYKASHHLHIQLANTLKLSV